MNRQNMTVENTPALLVVEFAVRGLARFLSHAETLRVFQRALVRAKVNVGYTCGFNPRPRLSLPLPRSVGLETEADLMCVRLEPAGTTADSLRLKRDLAAQLPQGFELLSVKTESRRATFQPRQVTYLLRPTPATEHESRTLTNAADAIIKSPSLKIRRQHAEQPAKTQTVDVRPFIESIRIEPPNMVVCCKISRGRSVRVDEILRLLELDADMLAAPVRRTDVKWEKITKDS